MTAILDRPTQASRAGASADLLQALSETTMRLMHASAGQALSVWLMLLGVPAMTTGAAASAASDRAPASESMSRLYQAGWPLSPLGWKAASAASFGPLAAWAAWNEACVAAWQPRLAAGPIAADAAPAADTPPPATPAPIQLATYRSSSGHAVAHVIVKQPSGE